MNKSRLYFSAMILSSLLSACAVGPDYQPPQQVLNVDMKESYQPVFSLSAWWDQFNDDQLSALIAQALAKTVALWRLPLT